MNGGTGEVVGAKSRPGAADGDRPGGRVDLHLHSTASDGKTAPRNVALEVAERGLSGFSLTDHDTVDGLEEAAAAAEELGLRFLPGAELSANEPGRSIHVLAYGFDPGDPEFNEFLSGWRETRHRRAERIVELLREQGVPLRLTDVEAEADGGVLTRAHVGRALVSRELVPHQSAAFDRWLSRGKPCFVEKPPLRPAEVFERVHAAGGVAVIAHPGRDEVADQIRRWAREGVDGVEVLHPSNAPALRRRLRGLASELDLFPTGGSDWHGQEPRHRMVGSEEVPEAWMDGVLAACESPRGERATRGARSD